MDVHLEGRLFWGAAGWECSGVWSTDMKKKASDKMPFSGRAEIAPALVHPASQSVQSYDYIEGNNGGWYGSFSPAGPAAPPLLLFGHLLPKTLSFTGSFVVLQHPDPEMNEHVFESYVLLLNHDGKPLPTNAAAKPVPIVLVTGQGENSYGTFMLRGSVSTDGSMYLKKHYWSPHRRSRTPKKPRAQEVLDRRSSNRKRTVSKVLSEQLEAWGVVGRGPTKRSSSGTAAASSGDYFLDTDADFLSALEGDDLAAFLDADAAAGDGARSHPGMRAGAAAGGGVGVGRGRGRLKGYNKQPTILGSEEDKGPAHDKWSLPVQAPFVGVTSWASGTGLGCTAASGDVYEGEVVQGIPHGYGTCMFASGLMLEGTWSKGVPQGWGVLSDDRDVTLFEGEFTDGEFNGLGTFYFENGDVYHGRWRQGLFDGKGEYTCKSGQSYSGRWKAGRPHGKGCMQFSCDVLYDGDWLEGLRHGRGVLEIKGGLRYDGMWQAGLFEGKGECVYPDGSSFEGTWRAGKKEGRGTFKFANGATYSGRFQDDKVIGTGTCAIPHQIQISASEWMIPFNLQTDVPKIHLRAGFDKKGN